jgi:predicted small lipoprotein YifL
MTDRSARRVPAGLASACAVAVLLVLSGCSSDGPSWFNFPSADEATPAGPVRAERGGTWLKPGADRAQQDAAVRQCNRVVAAQLERARQIDQDRQIGSATLGSGNPTRDVLDNVDSYSRDQRRALMFGRCMRSKGYSRR